MVHVHTLSYDSYTPRHPAEPDRLVQALQSPVYDDVARALDTLNALAFDVNISFVVTEFPGLLEALHILLERYKEDVLGTRASITVTPVTGLVGYNRHAPRVIEISAIDLSPPGDLLPPSPLLLHHYNKAMTAAVHYLAKLFKVSDPVITALGQCSKGTTNILRNMSFLDRKALAMVSAVRLLHLSAAIIKLVGVTPALRNALMDM